MRKFTTTALQNLIEKKLIQLNSNARTIEKAEFSINSFKWKGTFNPTPLSGSYTITIIYHKDEGSKIFLEGISKSDYRIVPHLYQDGSLCLFYKSEWSLLKHGYIPLLAWIDEWLFHYEVWKYTGEWTGGGIDHGDDEKEN